MILPAVLVVAAALQSAIPVSPEASCHDVTQVGPPAVYTYRGDRTCVTFKAPRRYQGVWLNYFEGQAYIDDASTIVQALAVYGRSTPWFNATDPLKPFKATLQYGHAYRVIFVGREARDMRRKPFQGYGHFNLSPGLVMVDDMLTIEDLGPVREVATISSGNRR